MVNSRRTGPFEQGIPNALTVEVEERWHAASSRQEGTPRAERGVGRLLELLAGTGVRATFFVLGAVAERQPEVVRLIHAAGHELGCHGHTHRPVGRRTPDEFRADLRLCREALQDFCGTAVDAYRAPDFSVTPACRWALDVLIEEGFVFDSSIDPARHDRSGVLSTPVEPYAIRRPGGTLWELTPPAWPCLSSPRFDLYPLARHGLQAANAVGRPFVVSLSSWEFDGQRAARTEERLRRLLLDFAFAPVSESLARWYERAGPSASRPAA
jgi:polysaccharide deacetylase family protein (PEP-CTERM system associated)